MNDHTDYGFNATRCPPVLVGNPNANERYATHLQKNGQSGVLGHGGMGGATYDACLRFLKEDPWQRLDALRKALPNTRLSMLLRGQNLLGYRHYADDVVKTFVELTVKHGIDIIRVFDALNDVTNLRVAIEATKRCKAHAQGAIAYTISPVHTIENFVELGKKMAEMGCDSIAIKDMAGLLTPTVTVKLYRALAKATGLPIHIHSHSTSGLADICLYQGVLSGCQHIDTAISSFSGGASHPATESMVAALADTPFKTELDLNLLLEINDYFKEVRGKYHQYESEANGIDPRVQTYQVPGGMISNLYNQLKEQNALDKLPQVHAEIPRVRKELGYPPLVTPTSQIVGTQAVFNVLSQKRYDNITNEVRWYCEGKYGKPPGEIDSKLKRKAIGARAVPDDLSALTKVKEMPKLKKASRLFAKSQEDLMSYALFPDVAKQFFEAREAGKLAGEVTVPKTNQDPKGALTEFDLGLHGEHYHVKVAGFGVKEQGSQSFFLWVDGVPEEVKVQYSEAQSDKPPSKLQQSTRAKQPGDVYLTIPGSIIRLCVKQADKVKKGDALLVIESMKMETEVLAPKDGVVESILCEVGEHKTPEDLLMTIV